MSELVAMKLEPLCQYAAVEMPQGVRYVRLWHESIVELLDRHRVCWSHYIPLQVSQLLLTSEGFDRAQVSPDPSLMVSVFDACKHALKVDLS